MTSKQLSKLEALELAHFNALANAKAAHVEFDLLSNAFFDAQISLSEAEDAADESEKALLKFKEKHGL